MDQGLPCAFCATPQSCHAAKRRFVKAAGHAIEQFEERLLKTVERPAELPLADLLAVARIHFPGLAETYLEYVVAKARAMGKSYVSDVEKIAALARLNAGEAGRPLPALADINTAIAEWFDELWNSPTLVKDVKPEVLEYLKQLYENHAPEFISYKALFHIFEKFPGDAGKTDANLGKTSLFETDVAASRQGRRKDASVSSSISGKIGAEIILPEGSHSTRLCR